MAKPIVSPNDSPYNIEDVLAFFAQEAAFAESHFPLEPGEMGFAQLQWEIPSHLWQIAMRWRIAEDLLGDADLALGQAIYEIVEKAQSVAEVDRIERALCRWMDATQIAQSRETGGADYVRYRAKTRREDLLSVMPYSAYLQSAEWQAKRLAALERADHRCQLCNRDTRLHVHHRTYERRGYELPGDLIVLCADCHKMFHDNRRVAR